MNPTAYIGNCFLGQERLKSCGLHSIPGTCLQDIFPPERKTFIIASFLSLACVCSGCEICKRGHMKRRKSILSEMTSMNLMPLISSEVCIVLLICTAVIVVTYVLICALPQVGAGTMAFLVVHVVCCLCSSGMLFWLPIWMLIAWNNRVDWREYRRECHCNCVCIDAFNKDLGISRAKRLGNFEVKCLVVVPTSA